jgi:catechol 2,3-dioxygenase-like lactoylglutathione lyase family enzyme
MLVQGLTHIAIDVKSPTRVERYLREAFGLQSLYVAYWKGEFIRVMGSPHHQQENPGLVYLHLRPDLWHAQINHIGFNFTTPDVPTAVEGLQSRGIYVDIDGDDMLYGPEDLRIQVDSYTNPRPIPTDDQAIVVKELPVDPDLPCMVRKIHHVAVDMAVPSRAIDWLSDTFQIDGRRRFARRGELISGVYNTDGPVDAIGRRSGLLPIFKRPGISRVRLNHIAFDVADCEAAIVELENKGVKVDIGGDAMIHGPEELWLQLDSNETPYPVGHPANDALIRLNE